MGQPPGPRADYGEDMKAVARDTEALGTAFAEAEKSLESDGATAACFGRLGEETTVGEVFENTRHTLATSLGKAQRHAREIGEATKASFVNMDTRDAASEQEFDEHRGEM